MAIAKVRDLVTAQNLTSQASTVVSLSGIGSATAVDNYLIARVAVDNSGGGGAAPGLTVTDTKSNAWTVLSPANIDPGAASAGATCYIAYCRVATALTASDSITFAWGSGNPTAKAIGVEEWSGIHASTPVAVTELAATGTSGTPSVSRTPAAAGQLFYGALAIEGPSGDTYTQDADTTDGSWVTLTSVSTTSGTATSNQTVRGACKLVTGTSSQTWNPTITSRDWAQLGVVFAEATSVIPVSASDSGTGTDTMASQGRAIAEASTSSTDTGTAAAAVSLTEAGTGADVPAAQARVAGEAATASDAASVTLDVPDLPGLFTAIVGTRQAVPGRLQPGVVAVHPVSASESAASTDVIAALSLATSDAGASLDTPASLERPGTDAAAGTDAGTAATAVPATDTAEAADAPGAQARATAEAADGTDAAGQGRTTADGGSGSDAELVAAASTAADSATASDTAGAQARAADDQAAADDPGILAAAITGSDAGTGTDSTSDQTQAAADAALGDETATVATTTAAADSGVAADSSSDQTRAANDQGDSLDTAGVTAAIAGAETGIGADAGSLTSQGPTSVSDGDSGSALDTVTGQDRADDEAAAGDDLVSGQERILDDAGAGTELGILIAVSAADSAAAADALAALVGTITSAELGTGADAGGITPETPWRRFEVDAGVSGRMQAGAGVSGRMEASAATSGTRMEVSVG